MFVEVRGCLAFIQKLEMNVELVLGEEVGYCVRFKNWKMHDREGGFYLDESAMQEFSPFFFLLVSLHFFQLR